MRVQYVNKNGLLISYDLTQYAEESLDDPPPPSKPTAYALGSVERIEEMAVRVRRGEAIWHDDDARNYEEWFSVHKEPPRIVPMTYINRSKPSKKVRKSSSDKRGRRK